MSYYNGGYHDTYEDYDTRHTAPGFNQLSGGYIKGKTAAGKADDRIITIPYAKENAVSEALIIHYLFFQAYFRKGSFR